MHALSSGGQSLSPIRRKRSWEVPWHFWKSLRPAGRLEDYQLIAEQPCEYLVQEASMAFVKTMMSVFGFPRFIPASRFFANAGETVTDLSSASGKKSWLNGKQKSICTTSCVN